ncbi:sodium-coupled monocarboxylate transporter 2-like isoform X1 [Octopus sinensis]|uniref:Sodium-coupled monocarboxylate transporter 2-like isoform X1 n=1 Tax=Octopus sinensis TaxID=2607531 RepID=A0A7E6EMA5_9MOLL|nr:sodium-coupled monocarboxylate transporter 2-like isoform X1 [Octopus sinensis]XP_036356760.1 sodium-coupled monocarboxylate transporter 2-like isoform X1 [Octopus sinensis]XP_036356761.1 sodium-coupled monocarboxylate transporter 2-like isoform X1 [Octopus sinensis]XP_036356762.1 sodium-coupled monocarboxylate transporter 2-like isoform X1 [Octopus sinensis]
MGISFLDEERNTFSPADYVMFALLLVVSASIGIFYAIKDRKKTNTKDFLLAGGNMNPIPVALSLVASFMSAITLLGTPSEMYSYTTMYWYIAISYFFVCGAAAHLFTPAFYRLRVTSVYEYLELRFSKGVRTAGSITFSVQMLLYMAIVLYAPSLALNAVTGFDLWWSVVAVGLVCTFYTTLGGMKAVLWTDAFQVVMMMIGLLATLIEGSIRAGGFASAWKSAEATGRVVFNDFDPDPKVRHSFWSLTIGGFFTWVAVYGVNQAQVQRACTCKTLRGAQLAMWLNFPGLTIILMICCLIGMVLYDFYKTCDPKSLMLITQGDQLLPLFVMDILGQMQGLPGLFVSCLFSGALSTISSGLNSLSTVILQDVIKAYIMKDLPEKKATIISKILVVVLGLVCLALAYVASLLGSVLQAALSLFGIIGGPLLGIFVLGLFFPWANKWGAFSGLFTALGIMMWIGIGAQIEKYPNPTSSIDTSGCNWNLTTATPASTNITAEVKTWGPLIDLYRLSYLWFSAEAVLIAVGVGLIISFITGASKPAKIDPRLIVPIFDILFPCLPEKIRKPLRFGVNHKNSSDSQEDQCQVQTISGRHVSHNQFGSYSKTPNTRPGILKTPSHSISSVDSGKDSIKTTSFSDDISIRTISSKVSYESSV